MNSFLVKEVSNQENTKRQKTKVNLHHKHLRDFQKRINWDELEETTFQYYFESGIGHLMIPTITMLKVYLLQQRYQMSASYIVKALSENESLRRFALTIDVIPDTSSIKAFTHLLNEKNLSKDIEKAFAI